MATAFASELATKVRAWIGGQTTTSLDLAPASYQLETTAATSEKYAVVLAAVYTVGPRNIDAGDDKISPAGTEEPLLRRAKLLAQPDRVILAGASCPCHVRSLLNRHVSALAAGTSMEDMLNKDSLSFMNEVLGRVNRDLLLRESSGGGGGLLVYGARVEQLGVQVPCDTVSVVAEEGAAPTTAFTHHHVARLQLNLPAGPEEALSVSVDAEGDEPATRKQEEGSARVVGVGAEFHIELRGKTTHRLVVKGKITPN